MIMNKMITITLIKDYKIRHDITIKAGSILEVGPERSEQLITKEIAQNIEHSTSNEGKKEVLIRVKNKIK